LAGQRRGDEEDARLSRHRERPAVDGDGELGAGQQFRHGILRRAGEVAWRLRVERIADRRERYRRGRQHHRCAGQRLQRRHRHRRRLVALRRGRDRPQHIHEQRRADKGADEDKRAKDDAARAHN